MGDSAKKRTTGFSAAFPEENAGFRFAERSKGCLFWTRNGLGWIIPAILIAGWELLARAGLIDISLFSSPSQIAAELLKITSNGELRAHLEATSLRVLSGFAIGVSAATLLGALTGYSGLARRLIMGASRGLGYLLIDGQTTGRPAIMMSSVILFAICGKVSDGVLATMSERWLYWQDVYKT